MLTKKPSTSPELTKTGNARTTKSQPKSLFDDDASYNGKSPSAKSNGKSTNTTVLIKYDVGFHNFLTIRGNGGGLSWEHGTPLKNIGHDEWIWETKTPINSIEFKILINDNLYESGDNHVLNEGKSVEYTPVF